MVQSRRPLEGGTAILPDTPHGTIKIGVAEDHPLSRRGLVQLLESTEDMEVVGQASDGDGAIELADGERGEPDVIVVDLRMPGVDGLEATRLLREGHPDVRVVILTANEDPEVASEAVPAGASAYVLKSAGGDEVLETLRMVTGGHAVFDRTALDGADRGQRVDLSVAITLSDRERDVLILFARGLPNRAIAERLGVSVETVKTHLSRLYRR